MDAKRRGQIKEVYDRALDLHGDERVGFLAEACAADTVLLAEVDSLLRAHEQAGSFLAEPVCELAAEPITACEGEGLMGQALGHYQLVGLLGRGGMGEVYLAQDTRLNRMVALKILPAGVATDRDRMRRFIREAKAASCHSPKLYPASIFNHFFRPPAAHSDDATLRLRRSQNAPPIVNNARF